MTELQFIQLLGQRRRDSVPIGHLLLHGGAGDASAGVAGAEAARVEGGNRDRAAAGEEVLPRGGLPPAVSREGRPVRQETLLRPHPLLRLNLMVIDSDPPLEVPCICAGRPEYSKTQGRDLRDPVGSVQVLCL